jgi:hypothetical protein
MCTTNPRVGTNSCSSQDGSMTSLHSWRSSSSFVENPKNLNQKQHVRHSRQSGINEEGIRLVYFKSGYYQPYSWYNPLRYIYRQKRKNRIDAMLHKGLTIAGHLAANMHELQQKKEETKP